MSVENIQVAVQKIHTCIAEACREYDEDHGKENPCYLTIVDEYVKESLIVFYKDALENMNPLLINDLFRIGGKVLEVIAEESEKYSNYEYGERYDFEFAFEKISMILKMEFGGDVKTWVNVYEVRREFGGHEEGGWWYDNHHLVDCKQVNIMKAKEECEELQKTYGKLNGRPLDSVLGGSQYIAMIEETKGASRTKEKPIYE